MTSIDQQIASQIANIEKSTERSLAEWATIIAASGLPKMPTRRRSWPVVVRPATSRWSAGCARRTTAPASPSGAVNLALTASNPHPALNWVIAETLRRRG
jgi:hypothetical protein